MFQASFLSLELVLLVLLEATVFGGLLAWSLRKSSGFLSALVSLPLVFSSLTYSFVFLSLFDELGLYEMRSLWGLSFILSLNLAPYMYFALKLGFKSFSSSLEESLALSNNVSFYKRLIIYIKFLIPFWGVGFGFLTLEVLSEFGASFLFGQETLSVYIYNLWLEQYNFSKAFGGFISLLTLVLAFFFLSLYLQKSKDLSSSNKPQTTATKNIGLINSLFPGLYLFTAVLMPVGFMFKLSLGSWSSFKEEAVLTSLLIAFVVTFAIFILYLSLNLGSLFPRKNYLKLPGVVYGVPGVLIGMLFYFSGFKIGAFSLIIALAFKYYKFFVDYMFSSWNVVSPNAKFARELTTTSRKRFSLDLRVSSSFVLVAFAMIFIEVLKELPITLMLKNAKINTLTTQIFSLVSEGDWELAAPYAVILFSLGFLALLINQYALNKEEAKETKEGSKVQTLDRDSKRKADFYA